VILSMLKMLQRFKEQTAKPKISNLLSDFKGII
jgi:hypothetical protein